MMLPVLLRGMGALRRESAALMAWCVPIHGVLRYNLAAYPIMPAASACAQKSHREIALVAIIFAAMRA